MVNDDFTHMRTQKSYVDISFVLKKRSLVSHAEATVSSTSVYTNALLLNTELDLTKFGTFIPDLVFVLLNIVLAMSRRRTNSNQVMLFFQIVTCNSKCGKLNFKIT